MDKRTENEMAINEEIKRLIRDIKPAPRNQDKTDTPKCNLSTNQLIKLTIKSGAPGILGVFSRTKFNKSKSD